MSQNIDDLWLNMAREQYPGCPDQYIQEMKIYHAMDWACNMDTEKAVLYDQYVMMKRLMDITPKEDD